MHRRRRPVAYRFQYRVFSLLLDVDELDGLSKRLKLFSHNRFNLISFHDRDFGPRKDNGNGLRFWAEQQMQRCGMQPLHGPIKILCFPRVLGYGFNPLSVWYCYRPDEKLQAVILEVRNTFGEKHQYLIPCDEEGRIDWPRQWSSEKCFHVSPFIGPEAQYRFSFKPPGERFLLRIEENWPSPDEPREDSGGLTDMLATWSGDARALSDRNLLLMALRVPFLGLKIITLIHWHALKLWLRGVPFHSKPLPPDKEVSASCPHDPTSKH